MKMCGCVVVMGESGAGLAEKMAVPTVLNKPLVDREEWLKLVRMERTAHRRALAPQRRILHRFFHPDQAP